MAEGGQPEQPGDYYFGSTSASTFSVRVQDKDSIRTGYDNEGTIKRTSSYLSIRKISSDETESLMSSNSTLQVTSDNESDNQMSSFVSFRQAEETLPEAMLKVGIQNLKETETKCILYNRSGEKEILCEFCLQDDIQTKATHFCNECGLSGMKLCDKCLRSHCRFSNHRNVISLLINTESSDIAKDGRKVKVKEKEKLRSRSEIYHLKISTNTDTYPCTAIDFAQMKNGNLIVADFLNRCLKTFYFDTLLLKEVILLKDRPECITCFPNNTLAVAYKDALCLETFEENNKTVSTFHFGDCSGLKSLDDKLYFLGNKPCTVRVLYLQDSENLQLIRTIYLEPFGIHNPDQIDLDEFGDKLYISDVSSGVFIFNKNEESVKSVAVDSARGITFDGLNKMFVCCIDSDKVLEINQDTVQSKCLLSAKHGVKAPCAVFVDRIRRRLFVGMHNEGHVLYVDIFN